MTPLPPTAELLQAASDRADAHPEQVFDRLFGIATSRHIHHNGLYGIGCDCIYCRALSIYTSAKVNLHRFRRRFEGHVDGYTPPMPGPYQDEITLQDDIECRQVNVLALRRIKNEAKEQIVVYNPQPQLQSHLTDAPLSVESSLLQAAHRAPSSRPIHSSIQFLDP